MNYRRILITGGTGFAGNHLLTLLQSSPVIPDALVATYLSKEGRPPDRPGVNWIPCDIRDLASVKAVIADSRPSLVYHLAAIVTVQDAWKQVPELIQTNVTGTFHLLEALRTEVQDVTVLLASSAEVYGAVCEERIPIREDEWRNPLNPYGLSKVGQEEMANLYERAYGMRILVARPFHYTGPGQPPTFVCSSLARQIAEVEIGLRKEILVGNLDVERDFTDIRDVVRAYTMIVEAGKPGCPYNVCRGEGKTIRDVLNFMIGKATRKVPLRVDQKRYRQVDVPKFIGDGNRILKDVGWFPNYNWDDMLSEILGFWREEVLRGKTVIEES